MSLFSLLPVLIILSGAYFLFKLDFFFLKHPIRALKFAFSGTDKKNSFFSLMLALAGTLGVGNISGVAIGLATGGAGSVLWLMVSALFSSAIKYSEVYISYHSKGRGILDVIKRSFGEASAFFALVYAVFILLLSLFMGSAFQARAIAEASVLGGDGRIFIIAPLITAFCITVALLGKDRIKGAVAVIIPLASIIYTGMCLFVIFSNFDRLSEIIGMIFSSAFSPRSAMGGIIGFISASGMKDGFARGLLSNEAGSGTSSLSHTSHIDTHKTFEETECMRAGIFGVLEVLFDTLFICPLTAFAILLGTDGDLSTSSLGELSKIFGKAISPSAPLLLFACIVFFAVSTTLCWYYYGMVALKFLLPKRKGYLFSALFFVFFFAALLYNIPHVLFITDTALFILSLISLSALIKNRALIRFDRQALVGKQTEF